MRTPALQRFLLPGDVLGLQHEVDKGRNDISLHSNPKLFVVTPSQSRKARKGFASLDAYSSSLRDLEAEYDDLFDYTISNIVSELDPALGVYFVKLHPDQDTLDALWEERSTIGEYIGAPAEEPRDIIIGTAKTAEAARILGFSAISYLEQRNNYIALDEMKYSSG